MIFCVEDDGNIRDLVVYTLNAAGFAGIGFENGDAFWKGLEKEIPELILLDIMLPGEDGMTLLHKLKSSMKTRDIPVIMLTAKTTEYDKVMGLDAGADDYIAKPFGMMELISRIKAVLRRTQKKEKGTSIEWKNIKMNVLKHEVNLDGSPISLTLKEFELLRRLMENQGIVLTRDQLLGEIWGYDYIGETRTVDVHVRTLRQKLGEAGKGIETVRGVGYRMGECDGR